MYIKLLIEQDFIRKILSVFDKEKPQPRRRKRKRGNRRPTLPEQQSKPQIPAPQSPEPVQKKPKTGENTAGLPPLAPVYGQNGQRCCSNRANITDALLFSYHR